MTAAELAAVIGAAATLVTAITGLVVALRAHARINAHQAAPVNQAHDPTTVKTP